MQSMPPLFYVVLRNSVQERGLWCTEYAFGAKSGLLVYARRFQRHSVQKTGIYGTEGKFGAKKRLLVYGGDIRYRREPPGAPDAASKAQNSLREEASKHKKRARIKVYQDFLDPRSARTVATACVYCGGGAFFIKKEDVFLGNVLEYTLF